MLAARERVGDITNEVLGQKKARSGSGLNLYLKKRHRKDIEETNGLSAFQSYKSNFIFQYEK